MSDWLFTFTVKIRIGQDSKPYWPPVNMLKNDEYFAKIGRLRGARTFFAIIASPPAIFPKIANFAKIASLQGATFGIQLKLSELGWRFFAIFAIFAIAFISGHKWKMEGHFDGSFLLSFSLIYRKKYPQRILSHIFGDKHSNYYCKIYNAVNYFHKRIHYGFRALSFYLNRYNTQ